MIYTKKHVADCSTGKSHDVELTSEEIASLQQRDANWKQELFSQAKDNFIASAQAALNQSDISIIRCCAAGLVVPSDIQNYRIALRAIVMGTDTMSTILPEKPTDYPMGS